MPPIRRRPLLAAATALPLAAIRTGRAQAAGFSYKLGTDLPPAHPLTANCQAAAERIAKATDGALKIAVYPSSQLGGDTEMLGQVRSGALEFLTMPGMILSTLVPIASLPCVGFAFRNTEDAFAAMDGGLGALIRAEIARHGLLAFDHIFDNNFRQITSGKKPIHTPADLAGMKIRIPAGSLWTSMFADMGASPTSLNFAEVYSALQSRLADGEENPLSIIYSAKLYEVQTYCSLTSHAWDGFWLLANPRRFARLPKDMQDIAMREFSQAAFDERAQNGALTATLRQKLAQAGLRINDVDQAPFRDLLRQKGFYATWKGKYGAAAWKVLESATGPLA